MTTTQYLADMLGMVVAAEIVQNAPAVVEVFRKLGDYRQRLVIRKRHVLQTALALRDAETDDQISQAWADFDQAVDDYRSVTES